MREKHLKETGLADMAFKVEQDHEVQMARAELYKLAKYAIKLHEMLKGVSEQQGLEGWVQAKITKAADYVSSVYHHMDYETKFEEVTESNKKLDEDLGKAVNHLMAATAEISKSVVGGAIHGTAYGVGAASQAPKSLKKSFQKGKAAGGKALGDSYEATLESMLASKLSEAKKKVEMCPEACCGKPVTECSCGPDCKHCDCYEKNKAMKESVKLDELSPETHKSYQAKAYSDAAKGMAKKRMGTMSSKDAYDNEVKRYKGIDTSKYLNRKQHGVKESNELCNECGKPSWRTLSEEKQKGVDGKVCWKGYKRMGTKKKGGKTVDNCVKM